MVCWHTHRCQTHSLYPGIPSHTDRYTVQSGLYTWHRFYTGQIHTRLSPLHSSCPRSRAGRHTYESYQCRDIARHADTVARAGRPLRRRRYSRRPYGHHRADLSTPDDTYTGTGWPAVHMWLDSCMDSANTSPQNSANI